MHCGGDVTLCLFIAGPSAIASFALQGGPALNTDLTPQNMNNYSIFEVFIL